MCASNVDLVMLLQGGRCTCPSSRITAVNRRIPPTNGFQIDFRLHIPDKSLWRKKRPNPIIIVRGSVRAATNAIKRTAHSLTNGAHRLDVEASVLASSRGPLRPVCRFLDVRQSSVIKRGSGIEPLLVDGSSQCAAAPCCYAGEWCRTTISGCVFPTRLRPPQMRPGESPKTRSRVGGKVLGFSVYHRSPVRRRG